MRFWLDMGVDGLRLDAIPYLVEREGTNNENLPETHAVLKRIRAEIDQHYPDRMLLAEANQWPEDVLPYFGDGDECHMAFHFPLMPRMYMALAQEDRHPITDIMRQTPDIPENCQWAIFLRNHDELTLEMVTDEERDYLWQTLRRRRARAHQSRHPPPARAAAGQRPAQDRADEQPAVVDARHADHLLRRRDRHGRQHLSRRPRRRAHADAVVARPQRRLLARRPDAALSCRRSWTRSTATRRSTSRRSSASPSSLLNWMRRMIAVRQPHQAFGRGTLRLLYPRNRKILAYLREHDGETHPVRRQSVALGAGGRARPLASSRAACRSSCSGAAAFPPIGDLPYLLTLPGLRLLLVRARPGGRAAAPGTTPMPEPLPDFITLVMRDGWRALLDGQSARDFAPTCCRPSWPISAGSPPRTSGSARRGSRAPPNSRTGGDGHLLAEVEVDLAGVEAPQRYFLPLSTSYDDQALSHGWPLLSFSLAQVRRGARVGALYDAVAGQDFPLAAIDAMRREVELRHLPMGHPPARSASGPHRPSAASSCPPTSRSSAWASSRAIPRS